MVNQFYHQVISSSMRATLRNEPLASVYSRKCVVSYTHAQGPDRGTATSARRAAHPAKSIEKPTTEGNQTQEREDLQDYMLPLNPPFDLVRFLKMENGGSLPILQGESTATDRTLSEWLDIDQEEAGDTASGPRTPRLQADHSSDDRPTSYDHTTEEEEQARGRKRRRS